MQQHTHTIKQQPSMQSLSTSASALQRFTCFQHISGCTRYVRDNGPIGAGPAVQQAALADIRPPNNCYLQASTTSRRVASETDIGRAASAAAQQSWRLLLLLLPHLQTGKLVAVSCWIVAHKLLQCHDRVQDHGYMCFSSLIQLYYVI